jgi:hypothetical protein
VFGGVRFWVEKEKRIGDLLFSKSEGCKSWIVVLVGVWREKKKIRVMEGFCFTDSFLQSEEK